MVASAPSSVLNVKRADIVAVVSFIGNDNIYRIGKNRNTVERKQIVSHTFFEPVVDFMMLVYSGRYMYIFSDLPYCT